MRICLSQKKKRNLLNVAELDHRGDVLHDVLHGSLPLDITAPTLSMSLNPHRSTQVFMSGFFGASRCDDFNAAQHLLSKVLHRNNWTLSDLQPSGMTSSQNWPTTFYQDVFDLVEHLDVLSRAGHRFCRNPMLSPS